MYPGTIGAMAVEILRKAPALLLVLGTLMIGGCAATPQIHTSAEHRALTLRAGDLDAHGIAFITPSTVTGQEEEKQAVALTFSSVFARELPQVRMVTLSETLSVVNQNALGDGYRQMFIEYRDTGIFHRATLRKLGALTGVRYIAQLKLAGFSQGSNTRFGILGLRMVDTQFAKIRLFLQIWDSHDGGIAWEGLQELVYAEDIASDKTITLKLVMEHAAQALIARLPGWQPRAGNGGKASAAGASP